MFEAKKCQPKFNLRTMTPYITLEKSSKIDSLDMSQNQIGISSRFSSRNSSQNFLLNCHAGLGQTHPGLGGKVRQERRFHKAHLRARAAQEPGGPHAAARHAIRNGIQCALRQFCSLFFWQV